MTRCKDCDREVVKGTLQCPGCGSRIEAAESLTSTRRVDDFHSQPTPDSAGRPQQAAASSTPFDDDAPIPMPSMSEIPGKPRSVTQATEVQFLPPQTEGERFTPGRVLADRYLILGRIGEGAMGEVYRAEDRRLGGQVALKFLSEGAAADADGLKRLLTEAHLARQITHPNVCRVFDVGDVDGHTFISMEYIDGETFSSLLRRIGRLPADKALSVAHQMCAGLAWAHERGILHRDLKPANVMLDGGGEVKIADFGLAGLAEELRKDKHRAGTPAYMSPEQLLGEGSSVRSDIYSLGLVLYELFTGKPVYRPSSIKELERLHEQPIPRPSTIVPELPPEIDRAIMWCLERDPANRPESVRELSACLPGGNALEAVLLAGQTPSPRLVAAAGGSGLISPRAAALLALLMLVACAASLYLGTKASLLHQVPVTKAANVLADRAEEMLESLGFSASTPYKAYAYDLYEEYLDLIRHADKSPSRWNRLALSRPAAIDFWYRQSPRPLLAVASDQRVTVYDPPFTTPGMITIRLDPRGRLRQLDYFSPAEQVTSVVSTLPSPPRPAAIIDSSGNLDAARVLLAAGLLPEQLTPERPIRIPPVFADTRLSWRGVYPEAPSEPIRVEAAFLDQRLVAFRIVEEKWVGASMAQPRDWTLWEEAGERASMVVEALAILGALVLAWRNLRLKHGDREGALRTAAVMFAATLLSRIFLATPTKSLPEDLVVVGRAVGLSLPVAIWFWLFYIALEPYLRRLWPEVLISWSRLVAGGWKDPLVGLHVAVGGLAGILCSVIAYAHRLSAPLIGVPPGVPWIDPERGVLVLGGPVPALGVAFGILPYAARFGVAFLLALVILMLIFRKRWLAATIYAAVQTTLWMLSRGDSPASWIFMAAVASISTLVVVRLGLLGLVSGVLFFIATSTYSSTFDIGRFYSTTTVVAQVALLTTFGLGLSLAAGLLVAPHRGTAGTTSVVRIGGSRVV